ncbi:MAG TPA: NAD-dependent epimerase/dehydratase family protein [Azospirillaceae bacterium]|nr:NAD-dependent epimerase/dehydratase family protein [Azospirillaceae bacterium]
MTHYLVTGGAGFIGAALVRRLLEQGHTVRVLDNGSRGSVTRLVGVMDDIEFHNADVRCTEAVIKAARGMECILHLAAVNGTQNFYQRPALVLDVGVRGMLAVLDACRRVGVGELFVASSSEVYQTPPEVPTDETAPLSIPDVLNPRYSYGGSKLISELLALNYARRNFDRVVVFRPHNVYGAAMGWEHVIPQFVEQAVARIAAHPQGLVPFPIQGDGRQTRAFMHIDDFVDALMVVIDRAEHRGIYHIGNPEELPIAEVARKVMRELGREAEVVPGEPAAGGTLRRCPDIAKLRALGFEPGIPFDEGLPGVVAWYVENLGAKGEAKPPPLEEGWYDAC